MNRCALSLGLLSVAASLASAEPPATLRLDYFHTGNAQEERFSLDVVVLEGPWPGNPHRAAGDLRESWRTGQEGK